MEYENLTPSLRYILEWLEAEGYAEDAWDGVSEDGHWLVQGLRSVAASYCPCCQEPVLITAKRILPAACGWTALHFEALAFLEQQAMEQ